MRKKNAQSLSKETLISILFTAVVITAMVIIFLLAGRRTESNTAEISTSTSEQAASGSGTSAAVEKSVASGAASSATAEADHAQEETNTAEEEAATTPIPAAFGQTSQTIRDSLNAVGLFITEEENGLAVSTVEDPVFNNAGHLQMNLDGAPVTGFILSYPVIDTKTDEDGSAIAGALTLTDSEDALFQQAREAETVFYAVLNAYDPDNALPLTVRSEWCSCFMNTLSAKSIKSSEDTYGKFRFSLYTYGSGVDTLLCCSVQYRG